MFFCKNTGTDTVRNSNLKARGRFLRMSFCEDDSEDELVESTEFHTRLTHQIFSTKKVKDFIILILKIVTKNVECFLKMYNVFKF